MNERVKELIEQATVRGEEYLPGNDGHPTPTMYFDKEKFAELIVRECARVANDSNQSKNRAVGVSVGDVVREHFGVDE